jgi:cytochrome c oxidase subunit 2
MEKRARLFLILILLTTLVFSILSVWQFYKPDSAVLLHARMPENGGWSQENFTAAVGQPLNLKIVSDDVVHGFAIGQQSEPDIELMPGDVQQVSLTFDQPGTYTFYCTRWCGPNHWRMRGKIEVSGDKAPASHQDVALFISENLDIDAEHETDIYPLQAPKLASDSKLNLLPEWALETKPVWLQSPSQTFTRLTIDPLLKEETPEKLWELTAKIYYQQTSPSGLLEADAIFNQQCAACHGEEGRGDGVMVRDLVEVHGHETSGHGRVRPPDFTDSAEMLGTSPAMLEGKIIRGGMGTGMPYWGSIYTRQQIHDLAIYIYTFSLLQEVKP